MAIFGKKESSEDVLVLLIENQKDLAECFEQLKQSKDKQFYILRTKNRIKQDGKYYFYQFQIDMDTKELIKGSQPFKRVSEEQSFENPFYEEKIIEETIEDKKVIDNIVVDQVYDSSIEETIKDENQVLITSITNENVLLKEINDDLQKDITNLSTICNSLDTEKSELEKQIIELTDQCTSLELENISLKDIVDNINNIEYSAEELIDMLFDKGFECYLKRIR